MFKVNTVYILHRPMGELICLVIGEFNRFRDLDIRSSKDIDSFKKMLDNSRPGVLYVLAPEIDKDIEVVIYETKNGCMVIGPDKYCEDNVPQDLIINKWTVSKEVDSDGFLRLITASTVICSQSPHFFLEMTGGKESIPAK